MRWSNAVRQTFLAGMSVGGLLNSAANAAEARCSGGGCEYVIAKKVNGCVVFENKSPYQVTVNTGVGSQIIELYAYSSETYIDVFSKRCMKNVISYKATAHGVPPKKKVEKTKPDSSEQPPLKTQRYEDEPPPTVVEEAPRQYQFEAVNRCPYPAELTIKYLDLRGKWQTKTWVIENNYPEGVRLTSKGKRVLSENALTYYNIILPGSDFDMMTAPINRVETVDGEERDFAVKRGGGPRDNEFGRFYYWFDCRRFPLTKQSAEFQEKNGEYYKAWKKRRDRECKVDRSDWCKH